MEEGRGHEVSREVGYLSVPSGGVVDVPFWRSATALFFFLSLEQLVLFCVNCEFVGYWMALASWDPRNAVRAFLEVERINFFEAELGSRGALRRSCSCSGGKDNSIRMCARATDLR